MATGRPDYNLMTAIRGQYGAELKVVAVDGAGRIIMVPIGSSGNYMLVDANGYLASIMKGLDGATLRTIAVDGSGNILGLLQGWYEGAVKTLAVDAQGRMLAVLTDPEDVFGNPHYMGAAELAVRLGSISSHERRGQMIWFDDFECGHLGKWKIETYGATSQGGLRTQAARNGAFSMYLYACNEANAMALARHSLPYPSLSKYGLEGWICIPTAADGHLNIGWFLFDGTNVYSFLIRYCPDTGDMAVLDSDDAWKTFATGVEISLPAAFYVIKLVIDITTKNYVRCLINDAEYDLSAYSALSAVSSASPLLRIAFDVFRDTEPLGVYVDDVIVTQNES